LIIRQEKPGDYSEVYSLVKRSFATTSASDGTEQDYLNELRTRDTFIPELSLVAENNEGQIMGQIVLYKMTILTPNAEITELVLSPICVDPNHFRRGLARSMIDIAIKKASDLGYSAIFLCGDPKLYRKLGFRPSYEFGIYHIKDKAKNAEWCMVRGLKKDALSIIEGVVDIE
jgi:predicted N-acetyltransferase YhbS